MKKLIFGSLIIIVAIGLVFTGCANPATTSAPPSKTINIGSVEGLTGMDADSQVIMNEGTMLCKDWVNANGGITIKGQKYLINVISKDTKSTSEGDITAAQQLVFQDKVQFVVGEPVPFEVGGIRGITDPNKVLYLAGVMTDPGPKFPYSFTATFPYRFNEQALYAYLLKTYPNVKTVAVVNQDEAGNKDTGEASIALAQKNGLTVVNHTIYPFTATDLLPIMTKVVATNPDAIDICLSMPSTGASMVKDARQLGFTGPMWAGVGWPVSMVLDQIGPTYATDFFFPSLDVSAPELQSQIPPETALVMKAWNDKYHVPFNLDSAHGWGYLYDVIQAIQSAQSVDATDVAKAFASMKTIQGEFGAGTMGGLQTYGVNNIVVSPSPMTRLKNGKSEFVGWFPVQVP